MKSRFVRGLVFVLAGGAILLGTGMATVQAADPMSSPDTPAALVATYDNLAVAILAVKQTEAELVRSILGAAYAHAQVELGRARGALASGNADTARGSIENLAAAVGQLATEGDNAVAGIRKRLLEGGHHHNAAGEAKGIFDPGFVIITREAKQSFLDASKALAQVAQSPDAAALDAAWKKVDATWGQLMGKKS